MRAFYATDTNCYYERNAPGAEHHIEVAFRPSKDHQLNLDTLEWYLPLDTVIKDLSKNCDRHLETSVFQTGFPWGEYTIRCDAVSQQNATGFMTAIAAGMNPFPIVWRTIENVNISFADVTEFKPFAETMMAFINEEFQRKWMVKDTIASAQTAEDAQSIYDAYIGGQL